MTRELGLHWEVSTMSRTSAMHEDEGQYLQSVLPQLGSRTVGSCAGSIATCPKMAANLLAGDVALARREICRGWVVCNVQRQKRFAFRSESSNDSDDSWLFRTLSIVLTRHRPNHSQTPTEF